TEYQDIDRIAVVAIGARHEAVIRRIMNGAVKDAIHPQQARGLIEFVLDLRAFGNLDVRREPFLWLLGQRNIMPGMYTHRKSSSPGSAAPLSLYQAGAAKAIFCCPLTSPPGLRR